MVLREPDDFGKESIRLIQLIQDYLNGKTHQDQLNKHAWDVINRFSGWSEVETMNERPFWYTIWLIQHMADTDHEKNGYFASILAEALGYLQGQPMPANLIGRRP